MSATVVVRHGGDDIVHAETAVHISTTELPSNTATGYDPDNYPASPEVTYYLEATIPGRVEALRSQVAAPNGGAIYWEGVIFPIAGTWTVAARKVSDDSSVASADVTVE